MCMHLSKPMPHLLLLETLSHLLLYIHRSKIFRRCSRHEKKEKNHYIFSSQLRPDQMPGLPREGQLMCTLFLSMRQ